jgi:hypothetical protein
MATLLKYHSKLSYDESELTFRITLGMQFELETILLLTISGFVSNPE